MDEMILRGETKMKKPVVVVVIVLLIVGLAGGLYLWQNVKRDPKDVVDAFLEGLGQRVLPIWRSIFCGTSSKQWGVGASLQAIWPSLQFLPGFPG